jgi:hypothetical protein
MVATILALPCFPMFASLRAAFTLSFDGISPPLPATMIKVLERQGFISTLSACAMLVESDSEASGMRRRSVPSMSQRMIGRGTAFSIRFETQKRYGKDGARDIGISL